LLARVLARLVQRIEQNLARLARKRQRAARHLHARTDPHDARRDPVPGFQIMRARSLAHAHRLAAPHEVARQKRLVEHDVADLVKAHHRRTKRRDIGLVRDAFVPAPPLQIVVGDVAPVIEVARQEIFERTRPGNGRVVIADDLGQLLKGYAGIGAGLAHVEIERLGEGTAPLLAANPRLQTGQAVGARHSALLSR
jgi:hypothetical protein